MWGLRFCSAAAWLWPEQFYKETPPHPPWVSCSKSALSRSCPEARGVRLRCCCWSSRCRRSFSGRRLEAGAWSVAAVLVSRPLLPGEPNSLELPLSSPILTPLAWVSGEAPGRTFTAARGLSEVRRRCLEERSSLARSCLRVFPTKEAPSALAAESETRPEGGSDFLCRKLGWRLFHRAKPGRGAGLDPGFPGLSGRFC